MRNDDTEVLPQALFYKAEGQALAELFYRAERPHVSILELTYQVEQRRAGFTVYAPSMQAHDVRLNGLVRRYKLALTAYRVLYVAALAG